MESVCRSRHKGPPGVGLLSADAGEGPRATQLSSRDEEKAAGNPVAFSAEESIH